MVSESWSGMITYSFPFAAFDNKIVVKLKVGNLANNETIIYVSFYDGNFTVGLNYEKW